MKKILSAILITTLLTMPVFASSEATRENLNKIKEDVKESLNKLQEANSQELATYDQSIPYREPGTQYSSYSASGLSSDYYNKVGENPYTKSKIGEGILAAAATAAFAAGTDKQDSSSKQLRELASDLNGSNIPEYKEMASMLNKEADAIDSGDSVAAQIEANKIKDYYNSYFPAISSSYRPSDSEKEAVNPFAQFVTGFMGAVLPKLGGLAISKLSALLGLIPAAGGPLGILVAMVGSSLLENMSSPEGAGAAFGDKVGGQIDNFGKAPDSPLINSGTNSTINSGSTGGSVSAPTGNLNNNSSGSYDTKVERVGTTDGKSVLK